MVKFCANCSRVSTGAGGWYYLTRLAPVEEPRQHRSLGLYCSLACLDESLERLERTEAALGEDWWARRRLRLTDDEASYLAGRR